ncbi:MAG: rRNA maturation RNase YbeY [Bacteroidetes bacterium]|nr:rRNA maturation RNase YbeY [Bacteroidota bacterium]
MIKFINQYPDFKIKNQKEIKNWITQIIKLHKRELGQICYVIMSDTDLLEYNKKHLNHNYFTDIITFNYCEGKKINSDILISIDRIAENAFKFNVPFNEELLRVLIHGILHLCGFNDKTKNTSAIMRIKENEALKKFKSSFGRKV